MRSNTFPAEGTYRPNERESFVSRCIADDKRKQCQDYKKYIGVIWCLMKVGGPMDGGLMKVMNEPSLRWSIASLIVYLIVINLELELSKGDLKELHYHSFYSNHLINLWKMQWNKTFGTTGLPIYFSMY
jgi:hypothetical protein